MVPVTAALDLSADRGMLPRETSGGGEEGVSGQEGEGRDGFFVGGAGCFFGRLLEEGGGWYVGVSVDDTRNILDWCAGL